MEPNVLYELWNPVYILEVAIFLLVQYGQLVTDRIRLSSPGKDGGVMAGETVGIW